MPLSKRTRFSHEEQCIFLANLGVRSFVSGCAISGQCCDDVRRGLNTVEAKITFKVAYKTGQCDTVFSSLFVCWGVFFCMFLKLCFHETDADADADADAGGKKSLQRISY